LKSSPVRQVGNQAKGVDGMDGLSLTGPVGEPDQELHRLALMGLDDGDAGDFTHEQLSAASASQNLRMNSNSSSVGGFI
jgi:hypothetical protein